MTQPFTKTAIAESNDQHEPRQKGQAQRLGLFFVAPFAQQG
jgi:hypothetical protein